MNDLDAAAVAGDAARVFIAAPYTQWMDSDRGRLADGPFTLLAGLRDAFLDEGWAVFSAHANERWGEGWLAPEDCTPIDFRAVQNVDVLCAVLGTPRSLEVLVELGWASAFGKPIIVVVERASDVPHLVKGLSSIGTAEIVTVERLLGAPADGHIGDLAADLLARCARVTRERTRR